MIDGEGTGEGKDHKYVLLGVGDQQLANPHGFTDISEIFSFLYGEFLRNPKCTFAGFYLAYDFNMWLKLLPRDRAATLLTDAGRAKRKRVCECRDREHCGHSRLAPHPVEYKGWQFDLLGYKRMRLRPKGCDCVTATCACQPKMNWMYVNDAGPFFQASLLSVIKPDQWQTPIVTTDEYRLLEKGKSARGTAILDHEMQTYNRLENQVGSRLLAELNRGFTSAGIRLNKRQWFGPGQAAQAWMHIDGKLRRSTDAVRTLPRNLKESITATYYGGWFEIPMHGVVSGITHEYDINSAYPTVASRLPCMCGSWSRKQSGKPGVLSHAWLVNGQPSLLRICHVSARGESPYLGPLPYRGKDGSVYRPRYVKGWYWQHEIDAARDAGLITDITYLDWYEYTPCAHRPPLRVLTGLYESRKQIGKDTPQGKAYKLVYNSVYGKLAQSVGHPVYANNAYASLITSGCRTMILQAIASHPDQARGVVMIATDGVYFTSKHPGLVLSDALGDWSHSEKHDLTCFKPGVYWDNRSRELFNAGKAPRFKARGINAADFARSIGAVDAMFDAWSPDNAPDVDWPAVDFTSRFTQTSVLQAIQWTEGIDNPHARESAYKKLAGAVTVGKVLRQDSRPEVKRNPHSLAYDQVAGVWRTEPWDHKGWPESTPYDGRFGSDGEMSRWDEYSTPDGSVMMGFREALYAG